MIKKVMKNNKTSGKVSLPIDWVGTEVEVTKASEKKLIGDKSLEDLIDMIIEKTMKRILKEGDVIHENKSDTSFQPEKKIPIKLGELNLDDLACRPNPDFCGRDGSAVSNDICNICPNPVCKYFYEKKNLCNKENRYVKCKGNLRACTIKQDVSKEIGKP